MTEINQLPSVTAPAATDLYAVQQIDGTTRSATPAQITAQETARAQAAEVANAAAAANALAQGQAAASQAGAALTQAANAVGTANNANGTANAAAADAASALAKTVPATSAAIGLVKPGQALTVAGDGTLNVTLGRTAGTAADGGALTSETARAQAAEDGIISSVSAFSIAEISADTALASAAHANKMLVLTQPVALVANFSELGSGFTCLLVNVSGGDVAVGGDAVNAQGYTRLAPGGNGWINAVQWSSGQRVSWGGDYIH